MQAPEELCLAMKHYAHSRMEIYQHCGASGRKVRLRELLTGDEFLCHSTSGYRGKKNQLWSVRLVPPILDTLDYHLVLTTPYILTGAAEQDWTAFLKRQ